ncbi:hypothetical protein CYMTET_47757 [Cymbomonas tetramitiformis]|uniref:Uncharacterized protein n=1 Tax=Cymbomonas tetramitiformis TaxID=36881 RepID=A0AAE0BUT0_9CHLO|nr:hypothetical protein CYMTET_47757 [Cymbomonas tetramitiformis]|eukprot:gene367-692_t
MSCTHTYDRFNRCEWKSINKLVGGTFRVANYCFNGSSSKDDTEIDVKVKKVELRKGPKGTYRVVLYVKAADDGNTYRLPDWSLFTSTNGFLPSRRASITNTETYEEGQKRNRLFAKACLTHRVSSATVLDGPGGNTASCLPSSVKTIYQVNNDATTCIALGMKGYTPIFTKLVGSRNGGSQKNVKGVYEMLWYAHNRPSCVKPIALNASNVQAMALDIYGVWKPMYDEVLLGIERRGRVRVLLLTYSVRNSYAHPQLPCSYRLTSHGQRAHTRWMIVESITPSKAGARGSAQKRDPEFSDSDTVVYYDIAGMTEGTLALCASSKLDLSDEYCFRLNSESRPTHYIQVLCRNLRDGTLLCRYLKPRARTHGKYFCDNAFVIDEDSPMVAWCEHAALDILLAWDSDPEDEKLSIPSSLETQALEACRALS